ncbi:hypothetical protein E3N88_12726 [Mikania micrantha]|uniref:Photosystem I P700 chlorophyll a apoprotein A1 n=1 Tax=Mikania micrantha TaxID=192012 RepID=A0A5N6P8W7_9ASTR|nr:hypothetical protein E3N88_12726 [Mikania micrantha]
MPLEPRASWFSPKCVEAQQLTGHLGVKHCFGAGRESGTKSRQTLNTRYDLKITGFKVGQIQCPENLRVPPQGSSTEGESGPKIRPKGVVDGQQVNIPVLPLVGPEGRRRLDHVWGLKPAQCRKVKEVGDLMTGERATEAPVNDGRNYNGPKVAKFLVGTNWGIGHGLKDILEAHKGPFTGQGHKGLYEILTTSWHAQLSLNLAMLGSLTIVVAHHMYAMPPYPYLATDYGTQLSLFTHHMWIGGFLIVGAAAHAAIFMVPSSPDYEEHMKASTERPTIVLQFLTRKNT